MSENEVESGFESRPRFTLEEAQKLADESHSYIPGDYHFNSRAHVVDNQDGTYSVVRHICCEFCDYCQEESNGQTHHVAKEDIYRIVRPLQANQEVTDDFCACFSTKEECVGIMAHLAVHVELPKGVDPNDPRVQQMIAWTLENEQERGQDEALRGNGA